MKHQFLGHPLFLLNFHSPDVKVKYCSGDIKFLNSFKCYAVYVSDNIQTLIQGLRDDQLANFCRILSVAISDLDIYDDKSSCELATSAMLFICCHFTLYGCNADLNGYLVMCWRSVGPYETNLRAAMYLQ